ncbi:MAG: hypothetical protein IT391_01575 [Nitrospira sp.]|nr:hypothetical protein [Nitrospira sp.]
MASAGIPKLNLLATGPEIALLRGIQIVLVAVTVCAFGLAWWWGGDSVTEGAAAAQVEAAANRLLVANARMRQEMVQGGLILDASQLADLKQQVAFANTLSVKRRLSWARLLSDLEDATPSSISFTAVELNFSDMTVSLQGGCSSLQELHVMVAGFNAHPAFRKAILSSHNVEQVHALKGDAVSDGRDDLLRASPGVTHVVFTMTVQYNAVP